MFIEAVGLRPLPLSKAVIMTNPFARAALRVAHLPPTPDDDASQLGPPGILNETQLRKLDAIFPDSVSGDSDSHWLQSRRLRAKP